LDAHHRLYYYQTLITGVIAIFAALGTVLATIWSARREIAASKEQTVVAQQIATAIRLQRRRVATESIAFHAMVDAAMDRVLTEAMEAEKIMQDLAATQ
jgi:hypothetical protein